MLRGDKHSLSARSVAGHALSPDARTAIIMPICNEDVATVFAGLRATCESVAATGHGQTFDVFVLSDSYDSDIARAERAAWEDLHGTGCQPAAAAGAGVLPPAQAPHPPQGRQCGRLLPPLGQGLPLHGGAGRRQRDERRLHRLHGQAHGSQPYGRHHPDGYAAIGHVTLHARAQQFALRVTGRLFTLGMQFWQLGESHYWGHNAIIRVEPFMQHCALAPIPGKGAWRAAS